MNFYSVEKCIQRVKRYYQSTKVTQPFLINANNVYQYKEIKNNLEGIATKMAISSYCKGGNMPQFEQLLEYLSISNEKCLILEVTDYLKFKGEKELIRYLEQLCSLSISGKAVILCYQVHKYLEEILQKDIRNENRVCLLGEVKYDNQKVILVKDEIASTDIEEVCSGFDEVLDILEQRECNSVLVRTKISKQELLNSIYAIHEIQGAYEGIGLYDNGFNEKVLKEYGTEEQWCYLFEKLKEYKVINKVFEEILGVPDQYELALKKWDDFTEKERWLCFIALKISGKCRDKYINQVILKASTIEEFVKQMYREILDLEYINDNFNELYQQRKKILKHFGNEEKNVINFCKYAELKNEKAIYYLTDNTLLEKQKIIECLAKYDYPEEKIMDILQKIYPDLALYLSTYYFNMPFLDNYFQRYKYQKIKNYLDLGFLELVNEQAKERIFLRELPYRSEIFETIDKSDSHICFIDALGVEYLGYITSKCKEYGLDIEIKICHSNLPSITVNNKEFLDLIDKHELSSIKELDEIKHKGKEDFDYRRNIYPIHITRELEIIDEALKRSRTRLEMNECSKVIIISDHGASRLCVLNQKTYSFDVDSKGTHGGRCCAYNEELPFIEYAIEENGYYVLANYDRFKGGRSASVETHGGATLEEVVVPIIQLTKRIQDIEINILNPVIKVSFRKKAEIILYSNSKLQSVKIRVNNKIYDGEELENNRYKFILEDIKKAKQYDLDVFENGVLIKEKLSFTVEKEGSSEVDLF